jgi:hypothetical protein
MWLMQQLNEVFMVPIMVGGPAMNPEVNLPNLLRPATLTKFQKTADIAAKAA